ncbi:hypothetical protein B484DRAFT_444597 [Ochromonadaceae sp. CCMP2298]|nr:hypothetical protein B484DRAFT_444597 [Ochromonadaceae sp. CCMP2298]|mmetsp:Transcript_20240/g.43822  ORF Transcript_20240/g.43822 Transcript_20240/m.43822 type:complete len:209 (-) Transcript_20240:331-957(-)
MVAAMLGALMCLLAMGVTSKPITFKSNKLISRSISELTSSKGFSSWFAQPNTPYKILRCNPGIIDISMLEGGKVEAALTPLNFPGVVVSSIVNFDMEFDGKRFAAYCRPDSIVQKYTGNEYFANILQKVLPRIESCTVITYDEQSATLTNQADLAISFDLPDWFPIPAGRISSSGSASIDKNLETDINALLDKLLELYLTSVVVEADP